MSNKHKHHKNNTHKQHGSKSGQSKVIVVTGTAEPTQKSPDRPINPISNDTTVTLRFSALDTWFFRESKPMESLGGSELASVFPPPPRTILGAVRTAIGDADAVDWHEFKHQQQTHPCSTKIGTADDLGPLELSGPWLSDHNERLYPVPLFLLAKTEHCDTKNKSANFKTACKDAEIKTDSDDAKQDFTTFVRLRIGNPVRTYMGCVRLPELPDAQRGAKPLDQAWITQTGLETILNGGVPELIIKSTVDKDCRQAKPAVKGKKAAREVIRYAKELFKPEPRLGIARDNATRTVLDGMLYQTQHIRPKAKLAVEIDLPKATQWSEWVLRLGAEGRLAHVQVSATPVFPASPKPNNATKGIILILLTPARFASSSSSIDKDAWLPPGFSATVGNDGIQTWQGKINDIALTLHAAVIGKVRREGGWDMVHHKSRPMHSLIPAGSAYYMTVDNIPIATAITALHNKAIGADQPLGRGLLACGLWGNSEFTA